MKHLIFNVNGQSLERRDAFKPATGSVEYLTVSFTFSDDWSGTTKTAQFRKDDKSYPALINSSGVCTVPYEVLVRDTDKSILVKQYFYMSVEGVNGSRKITTDEVRIEILPNGQGVVTTPSTPTPDVFAQYVDDVKAQTKANADNAQQSAENAEASAMSAEESARSLKNDYSNALKGIASGAVVRVDDVSPVEHYPSVKVRSKNLIPYPYVGTFGAVNGVTFTDNGDGTITAIGTPTATYSVVILQRMIELTPGVTYHIGTETNPSALLLAYKDETGATKYVRNSSVTWSDKYTFVQLYLQYSNGQTVNETIKPYLVAGDSVTEYTPYIDPSTVTVTDGDGNTYIPDTDGTVEGIVSTMLAGGLSTDTENTYIDVEYNRDINVVIADILTKLS